MAHDLKGARYALWKNPQDLTERQQAKLASIAVTNKRLYRAYLLKEQLRQVFALKGASGIALLDAWVRWARRCRPCRPSTIATVRQIASGHIDECHQDSLT